jgi:hypothetical protein
MASQTAACNIDPEIRKNRSVSLLDERAEMIRAVVARVAERRRVSHASSAILVAAD